MFKLIIFRLNERWWCKTNSRKLAKWYGMYYIPTIYDASVPASEVLRDLRDRTGWRVTDGNHLRVLPTVAEMDAGGRYDYE